MKGQSPESLEKQIAYQMLRENGVSITKAAETLGYATKTGYTLEKKRVELKGKTGLLTDKRIKNAYKVVDKFMKGEGVGTAKIVKDSTVMQAAKMVIDRSDPTTQDSSGPNISFVSINLGTLEAPNPIPTIDITPSQPCGIIESTCDVVSHRLEDGGQEDPG